MNDQASTLTYRLLFPDDTKGIMTFPISNGKPVFPLSWTPEDYHSFWLNSNAHHAAEYKKQRELSARNRMRQKRRMNRIKPVHQGHLLEPSEEEVLARRRRVIESHRRMIVEGRRQIRRYDVVRRDQWLDGIIETHATNEPKIRQTIDRVRELFNEGEPYYEC
jgi:hypothetical protein